MSQQAKLFCSLRPSPSFAAVASESDSGSGGQMAVLFGSFDCCMFNVRLLLRVACDQE